MNPYIAKSIDTDAVPQDVKGMPASAVAVGQPLLWAAVKACKILLRAHISCGWVALKHLKPLGDWLKYEGQQ